MRIKLGIFSVVVALLAVQVRISLAAPNPAGMASASAVARARGGGLAVAGSNACVRTKGNGASTATADSGAIATTDGDGSTTANTASGASATSEGDGAIPVVQSYASSDAQSSRGGCQKSAAASSASASAQSQGQQTQVQSCSQCSSVSIRPFLRFGKKVKSFNIIFFSRSNRHQSMKNSLHLCPNRKHSSPVIIRLAMRCPYSGTRGRVQRKMKRL